MVLALNGKEAMKRLVIGLATALLTFALSFVPTLILAEVLTTSDETCQVHQQPLRRGKVPIISGLRFYPTSYIDAYKERFPNSRMVYDNGCVGLAGQKEVLYCNACRRAEEQWKSKHPDLY